MKDFFLARYKNKTRKELQQIIDFNKRYHPDAVLAAIELLNGKVEEEDPIEPLYPIIVEENKSPKPDFLKLAFEVRPFLRTYSYRDFLTILSLALAYSAFITLIGYYSNERFFENNTRSWATVGYFVVFLVNHIFYRIEHKRSNNFTGRYLNDLLLALIMFISQRVYGLILSVLFANKIAFTYLKIFQNPLSFLLIFFLFEIALSFVKSIFGVFRWRIF